MCSYSKFLLYTFIKFSSPPSELHVTLTLHKGLEIISDLAFADELREEICMRLAIDIVCYWCSVRSPLICIVETKLKIKYEFHALSYAKTSVGMQNLPIALFRVDLREIVDKMI